MPTYKVNVKWGKEKYSDVECNTDEVPMLFKAQLFALSGVAPERQKILLKGSVLKDDGWDNMKLKNGAQLMMMGSADALPAAPVEKTKFVEDMSENQLAKVLQMPPGLENLGNTCYMNSTLQCLKSVPELRKALSVYHGVVASPMNPDMSITSGIRDLFESMEEASVSISPYFMLRILHAYFPQFAEKAENGGFQQQDANECWIELVKCMQKQLQPLENTQPIPMEEEQEASHNSFVDQYFGGENVITTKCVENDEEPVATSKETFYQISCFIEKDVKYLQLGLKSRLEENISKHSSSLGRDAEYHKTCKINRLPAYLPVQMVRFNYKQKNNVTAKILKDIKFPMVLDTYDLCTEELQKKLEPMRNRFKVVHEIDSELMLQAKKDLAEGIVKEAEKSDDKKTITEPFWFPHDSGSSNSGYYQLQAVLTHKGRTSSSGHYVAWVRKNAEQWMMFDDDNVNLVTEEDVLKLSGGGDWHCAYVLLYGPKALEYKEEMESLLIEKLKSAANTEI